MTALIAGIVYISVVCFVWQRLDAFRSTAEAEEIRADMRARDEDVEWERAWKRSILFIALFWVVSLPIMYFYGKKAS